MHIVVTVFSLSRGWDKEKNLSPDGNRTHDFPYTGRTLSPPSNGLSHEVSGHILGSYVTRVLHTARVSNVESVMCGNKCKVGTVVSNCFQFVTRVGQRKKSESPTGIEPMTFRTPVILKYAYIKL